MGIDPIVGRVYLPLSEARTETNVMSMVSPEEWGENGPYTYYSDN